MHCALTRVVSFYARHQYPGSTAHGHLYQVAVTVTGTLDPVTQSVIDLATLDEILTMAITTPLGGRHLNDAIAEFASGARWPTCEAIAAWCWREIAGRLPATSRLERVRVAEDNTLWAECTGPT
ncbi:MAG: 6-carboxytetrahydropterin synthase [Gemmatimonadota bacterium]